MDAERKYKISDKTCCTCEFWTGARKPDINQKFVTALPRDKGKCFDKHKPIEKMAQDKMPCCKTWLVLKENNKSEALQELQQMIEIIKKRKPSSDL